MSNIEDQEVAFYLDGNEDTLIVKDEYDFSNGTIRNELWWALIQRNKYKKIKYWLENYDVVNLVNNHDNNILHIACYKNNIKLVALVLKYNIKVNELNDSKMTPLMISLRKNNIDILKLLLNKKATINLDHLFYATRYCSKDILLLLLESARHMINYPDYKNRSLLSAAATSLNVGERVEKTIILINYGANLKRCDPKYYPFHYMINNEDLICFYLDSMFYLNLGVNVLEVQNHRNYNITEILQRNKFSHKIYLSLLKLLNSKNSLF